MATDAQLIQALEAAASKVIGRELTQPEKGRLLELFNRSTAKTNFGRAQESLVNFSNITEKQLLEKAAASDDTDRVIRDLRRVADNWKK